MADDYPEPDSDGELAAGREVRVDAAHALRRGSDRRPAGPPAVSVATDATLQRAELGAADDGSEGPLLDPELAAVVLVAANPAMLAEHAASLADRLQLRLAEVDRRES